MNAHRNWYDGLRDAPEPTLEEIEHAMKRGERFRARAFRDATYAVARWLARGLRRNEAQSAHAERPAKQLHAA